MELRRSQECAGSHPQKIPKAASASSNARPADAIEAAFDKVFEESAPKQAKPAAPSSILDELFDAMMWPAPGEAQDAPESATDEEDSLAHESDSCDDFLEADEHVRRGADKVEEPEAGRFADTTNRTRPSCDDPRYERSGNDVYWSGAKIGLITAWNSNISCVCKLHPSCRTPASTRYSSDAVLEEWLLSAMDRKGKTVLSAARHQELAAALKQRFARPKAKWKAKAKA